MRFIKEEYHARFFEIADLGQLLKELGQHPQQESAVDSRTLDKALGGKNVYVAAAVVVGAHPVLYVQRRLAEKELAAFVLKGEQRALYSAYACGGDIAVHRRELGAVVSHELHHCTQILQIYEKQLVVIGHAEHDIQHALLHLGQAEQTRQEHRPHLRYRDAHGNAVFTEYIPEAGGVGSVFKPVDTEAGNAALHVLAVLPFAAHAGQVALDVGHEHGYAHVGEGLGEHLHRYRLAGAGRAGDQAVAVCHLRQQIKITPGLSYPCFSVFVHTLSP